MGRSEERQAQLDDLELWAGDEPASRDGEPRIVATDCLCAGRGRARDDVGRVTNCATADDSGGVTSRYRQGGSPVSEVKTQLSSWKGRVQIPASFSDVACVSFAI